MEACECVHESNDMHSLEAQEQRRSYSLICRGEKPNTVDDYLMLPVEDAGFVVIRQTIEF